MIKSGRNFSGKTDFSHCQGNMVRLILGIELKTYANYF